MGVFASLAAGWRTFRIARAVDQLKRYGVGYDAARPSRLDNWLPPTAAVNHLINSSSPTLRAKVRDLIRNFPTFTRAVNGYVAFVVGNGSRFQSLAVNADGSPNMAVRRKIESRFKAWMESDADVSGHMHYNQLKQLAGRAVISDGEGLLQEVVRKRYKVNPFSLLALEADRLTDLGARIADADAFDISGGVEYVKATGEPLAYHITDEDGRNPVRVEAERIFHIFQVLRPGQLRGVSPFAPAIIYARNMLDYTQSELDAAKMASKYLAFISSPTPDMVQASRGIRLPGAGKPGGGVQEDNRPPVEVLDNAVIEYFRDTDKFEFANTPNRPGDAHERFVRFVNRFVSITIDVHYPVISGDYSDTNYTTSRAEKGDNAILQAPHKFLYEHRLDNPVFHRWLDWEALTQNYLPDYWRRPELYRPHSWIPEAMPSVDPYKDNRADIDAIDNGLKSPQQAIIERGGNPEDVVRDLAAWKDWLEKAGVTLSGGASPLASNSQAVLDQTEAEAGLAEETKYTETK